MKTLPKKLLLLFSLLAITYSCEKDSYHDTEIYKTQSLKKEFTLENYEDNFVKNNLVIKWNDYNENLDSLSGEKVLEFDTEIKVESTLNDYVHYKLIARKGNQDTWKFELIKSSNNNEKRANEAFSIFNLKNFTGSLHYYNLEGENTLLEVYKEGKLKKEFTSDDMAKYVPPISGGHCAGCFLLVKTDHYIDYYHLGSGGSLTYVGSRYTGSTYEQVWVSGGYGGYYNGMPYDDNTDSYHNHYPGGGSGGGYTGGVNSHDEEVILDDSFLNNDKINCTYEQLLKNNTIQELLVSFYGEDAGYDLNFRVISDLQCNNSNNPSGCTQSNLESNGSITISIDQDYINTLNNHDTPTLFLARTIIHESIHANLYLALYEHRNGNTSSLPDINDFPQIYEQYRTMKNWQHEFMANHYINLMSQTLEEVHPYLNDQQFISSLSNYNMSLNDFYTSIAYMGLDGTSGMNMFLNDSTNAENFQISYQHALVNSTSQPNCD